MFSNFISFLIYAIELFLSFFVLISLRIVIDHSKKALTRRRSFIHLILLGKKTRLSLKKTSRPLFGIFSPSNTSIQGR